MSVTNYLKLFEDNYKSLEIFIEKEAESENSNNHNQKFYHMRLVSKNILSAIMEKIKSESGRLSNTVQNETISNPIKNVKVEEEKEIVKIFYKMGINLKDHSTYNAHVVVTINKEFVEFTESLKT